MFQALRAAKNEIAGFFKDYAPVIFPGFLIFVIIAMIVSCIVCCAVFASPSGTTIEIQNVPSNTEIIVVVNQ